jgi:hypothetical protein
MHSLWLLTLFGLLQNRPTYPRPQAVISQQKKASALMTALRLEMALQLETAMELAMARELVGAMKGVEKTAREGGIARKAARRLKKRGLAYGASVGSFLERSRSSGEKRSQNPGQKIYRGQAATKCSTDRHEAATQAVMTAGTGNGIMDGSPVGLDADDPSHQRPVPAEPEIIVQVSSGVGISGGTFLLGPSAGGDSGGGSVTTVQATPSQEPLVLVNSGTGDGDGNPVVLMGPGGGNPAQIVVQVSSGVGISGGTFQIGPAAAAVGAGGNRGRSRTGEVDADEERVAGDSGSSPGVLPQIIVQVSSGVGISGGIFRVSSQR